MCQLCIVYCAHTCTFPYHRNIEIEVAIFCLLVSIGKLIFIIFNLFCWCVRTKWSHIISFVSWAGLWIFQIYSNRNPKIIKILFFQNNEKKKFNWKTFFFCNISFWMFRYDLMMIDVKVCWLCLMFSLYG